MITADGYSKDPTLRPSGIVITLGAEFMTRCGGPKKTIARINEQLKDKDSITMWKARNIPKREKYIEYVYIIIMNRLYGRVKYGGYNCTMLSVWIALVGKIERPKFKRELKGFRGFRYCTDLW